MTTPKMPVSKGSIAIAIAALKNGALVKSGPDLRFKPYFKNGKYEVVVRQGLIAFGDYRVNGIGYQTLRYLKTEKYLRRICSYDVEVKLPGNKIAYVKETWYAYRDPLQ